MIFGSVMVIIRTEQNPYFKIAPVYWWLLISGAFICIVSFMWDYLTFSHQKQQSWNVFSQSALFSEIETYVPQKFNYVLFFIGFLPMAASVILSLFKPIKK
jgi:hypothetical protein